LSGLLSVLLYLELVFETRNNTLASVVLTAYENPVLYFALYLGIFAVGLIPCLYGGLLELKHLGVFDEWVKTLQFEVMNGYSTALYIIAFAVAVAYFACVLKGPWPFVAIFLEIWLLGRGFGRVLQPHWLVVDTGMLLISESADDADGPSVCEGFQGNQ
jgi:hypothetical protein